MHHHRLFLAMITLSLTVSSSTEAENLALSLDEGGWIRVLDDPSLDLTTGLTIEMWLRAAVDTSTDGALVSKWGDIDGAQRSYLVIHSTPPNALFDFSISASNNQDDADAHRFPAGVLTPGEWQHLACTFDGATRRTYINGHEVGGRLLPMEIHRGTADLAIGAWLKRNDGVVEALYSGLL